MISSSITRVVNRINTIEAKFQQKPQKAGDFARQLSELMPKSTKTNTIQANSQNQNQTEQLVRTLASRHGVKQDLAVAVARTESDLSQNAISPVGAVGVMQLMPETAQSLGVHNIHDIRDNIDGGVRYLKQMLETFKGDEKLAIAAYNAGPGAVQQYGDIPPYPETQEYVARVMQNLKSK